MSLDAARAHIHTAQLALDQALLALDGPTPPHPIPPQVIYVRPGQDLNAAINSAPDGAEIRVTPGTYDPIVVQPRGGTGGPNWKRQGARLVVRPDCELPDTRCTVDWADSLIKVRSYNWPAILFEQGAHDVTFIGVQPLASHPEYPLIRTGTDSEVDPVQHPSRLVFDRCLLLADPIIGGKRGIEVNCGPVAIVRCHVDGFWYASDSQAVAGWNGPGPFLIEDNHLVSSGENIIFGGGDAMSPGMLPQKVTVRGNTLTKPVAWMTKPGVTVKNCFELKACLEALVENNLLEYSWTSGQVGFLTVITPRNQDGRAPFTQVKDLVFRYNVMRHAAAGFQLLGQDYTNPSEITRNVRFEQNLIYDINPVTWPGSGQGVKASGGPEQVVFAHNTIIQTHGNSFLSLSSGDPRAQIEMRDNVLYEGEYGIMADNSSPGAPSWDAGTTPDSTLDGNLIARGTARHLTYPGTNTFTEPGESPVGADGKLLPKFQGAPSTDGQPVGCDVGEVLARTGVTL